MTSKFALVIANTEYQDESLSKLTAPGRDAEEFARILREPELAGFDGVQVLINESEAKTRRVIARFFIDRRHDDLLLMYFSGHGVRNESGQLFLAANDTEIGILEATGVPSEFITRSMNNSRSQRQLLILDCCNSGAFALGAKSSSALGKSMGMAEAFEGSGFGRIVLTATDATQYAWEGDKVIGDTQNSVFTHFLIQGLKGEADRDGDGKITVDELYDYAYEQVVRRTPKQTPGKWSYKQQGDIILRENLKPRDVKPAPLHPDTLELLASSSFRSRSLGIQDLAELLNSKHLGLAHTAEDKLREIAASDDSLSLRKTASDILANHGLSPLLSGEGRGEGRNAAPTPEPVPKPDDRLMPKKPFTKLLTPSSLSSKETLHPHEAKKPAPNNNLRWLAIGGIIFIGLSLILLGGNYLFQNLVAGPTEFPTPVSQFQVPTPTKFITPAQFQTITQVPPTFTPTPGIGSTMTSEKDGMTLLYVPAGEFLMGSTDADPLASTDEKPQHSVTLDAYWIDQTEVTNAMYAKCVDANQCNLPSSTNNFANSDYANHPVIYVSWNYAVDYCSWAGRRLPTEAEWEKAARGTNGNIYPWGNTDPKDTLLNYNQYIGDTTEAGSYESGKSIYGVYDMAGNVWEWVSSLYQPYPYDAEDGRENLSSSDARVLRGGSWSNIGNIVRSAFRGRLDPSNADVIIGFRCSRSP